MSEVTMPILLDETFAEKMTELVGEMSSIATDVQIIADGDMHNDWAAIKAAVDHGTAQKRLPVGSQIIDEWAKAAGTSYSVPWDVVYYDSDGKYSILPQILTPDIAERYLK